MKITDERGLKHFEPWSRAVETYNRIESEGKIDQLESMLEDLYPEGMTRTELNDLLWFDEESVFEWLGITDEDSDEESEDEEN